MFNYKFNVGDTVINLEDGTLVKIVAVSHCQAINSAFVGKNIYCIKYVWGELRVVPESYLVKDEKEN